MGDHFVSFVDGLITETTLDAAVESRNLLDQSAAAEIECSVAGFDSETGPSPINLVICRICLDEDADSSMEAPCSCSGSLKYAHRKCIQRWCDEKGDTTCEICHQQFKPGYTAPLRTLRGSWRISRRDVNNRRIIAMVSTDHEFLDPDVAAHTSRNVVRCRAVATILIVFLVLRQTLPIIVNRNGGITFPLMMLVMLKTVGIVLPVCMILRTVTSILTRQNHQQAILPAEEEHRSLLPFTSTPQGYHSVIIIHR
ncbi:hypothetical protein M569_12907 [Genlisea aurea]|uniref:Uncharacterized protein n=1 Tax=Genlisea aurea TaxID=192259 RepID=S8DQ68_9LAMI|nr:hypothetical protein M569_12907 [Genlisea aurea]